MSEENSIDRLIQILRTGDRFEKLHVLTELGVAKGSKAALPDVLNILESGDKLLIPHALLILEQIGAAARDPLLPMLYAEDEIVRVGVAITLARLDCKGDAVLQVLLKALHIDNIHPSTKLDAAIEIISIHPENGLATSVVAEQLNGLPTEARRTALLRLESSCYRGKALLPSLIAALDDDNWYIRCFAIGVIKNIGPHATEAIPSLLRLAKDKRNVESGEALTALFKITGIEIPDIRVAIELLAEKLGCSASDVNPLI